MKKLALFLFLVIFGMINVYGQEIPEEFYEQRALHEYSVSNSELTVSLDKSTYTAGETFNLLGKVNDYRFGIKVFFTVLDPVGQPLTEFNTTPSDDGFFTVQETIDEDLKRGVYQILVKYGEQGLPVTIEATLKLNVDGTLVEIKDGSSMQENNLNFMPQSITTDAGKPIIWLNEDEVVHTVVSGTVNSDLRMFSDNKFPTGVIKPGDRFQMELGDGNYSYFCRFHPWLTGNITVNPSADYFKPADEEENLEYDSLHDAESLELWSHRICDGCTGNVELSSDNKEGFSSIHLFLQGSQDATGRPASFDLNFGSQDLSDIVFLEFWIKSQGSIDEELHFALLDSNGLWRVLGYFDSNSFPTWIYKKYNLEHYSSQADGFDINEVKTLVIRTSPDSANLRQEKIDIFLDDLKWSKPKPVTPEKPEDNFLTISAEKTNYQLPESIYVAGGILKREADLPVSIQIINSKNELVQIEQIIPNSDNNFNFTLQSISPRLQSQGLYEIKAQYGIKEFTNSTSFTLSYPQSLEKYKGFEIYEINDFFYAIPFREGGFIPNYLNFEFNENKKMIELSNKNGGYSAFLSSESKDELFTKIDDFGPVGPYFIEDYKEFSIYQYGEIYYSIQSGLDFDSNKIEKNEYESSLSLLELKTKIDENLSPVPVLIEQYKKFQILEYDDQFYAILSDDLPFDFSKFENSEYSSSFSDPDINSIKKQIDDWVLSQKSSFPVSEDTLLLIWVERQDLRKQFPEVEQGNFDGLKKWANTTGWNEDKRLSALIPHGITPDYLIIEDEQSEQPDLTPILVSVISVIASGGGFAYYLFRRKGNGKSPSSSHNGPPNVYYKQHDEFLKKNDEFLVQNTNSVTTQNTNSIKNESFLTIRKPLKIPYLDENVKKDVVKKIYKTNPKRKPTKTKSKKLL